MKIALSEVSRYLDAPAPPASDRRCHALLLDDNPVDRRLIMSICRQSGLNLHFTEAGTIAEMKEHLSKRAYDVVFIDFNLADGDGLDALRMVKADTLNSGAATIMIAGTGLTSVAVNALKQGCDDYLLKDALDPQWLDFSVLGAMEKARLQRVVAKSERSQAAISAALRKFSKVCSKEMVPLLNEVLDCVTGLEAQRSDAAEEAARLEVLSANCRKLRGFLQGLEATAEQFGKVVGRKI